MHFRPSWSRTPALDVVGGVGSFEEKMHQAINGKKARTFNEKIDFVGYANFQSHLFDWGVKMVITRAFTQAEFFAYQFILTTIAEKEGGVRTA